MPPYKLERLDKERHDRKRFACGVDPLDRYLHQTARQARDTGTAVCYVLVEESESDRILGYFTLSQHAVDPGVEHRALFDGQPGLPRNHAIPATLLGRLAVDRESQGRGIGGALLARALEIALAASESVASVAVVVDPIDDNARRFYQSHGFELLNAESGRMFMPMRAIAAHLAPADPTSE